MWELKHPWIYRSLLVAIVMFTAFRYQRPADTTILQCALGYLIGCMIEAAIPYCLFSLFND